MKSLTGSLRPPPSRPSPSPCFHPIFSNILRPLLSESIGLSQRNITTRLYNCNSRKIFGIFLEMIGNFKKLVIFVPVVLTADTILSSRRVNEKAI